MLMNDVLIDVVDIHTLPEETINNSCPRLRQPKTKFMCTVCAPINVTPHPPIPQLGF